MAEFMNKDTQDVYGVCLVGADPNFTPPSSDDEDDQHSPMFFARKPDPICPHPARTFVGSGKRAALNLGAAKAIAASKYSSLFILKLLLADA